MTPKVSVVMCVYNGAKFVREALDSVLAQSLRDWELVFVDDGSSDGSPAIARSLADDRIRIVTHGGGANRGLANSRVLGSDEARGEYLLFLDHDDLIHSDALCDLAHILDTHQDVSAAFGSTRFWTPAVGGISRYEVQSLAPLGTGVISGRRVIRALVASDGLHPHVCSTMFRREEYLAARETGPIWHDMYEDTAILMKLAVAHDFYVIDRPVSDYRIREDSMSSTSPPAFSDFLQWAAREIPLDLRSRMIIELTRFRIDILEALGRFKRSTRKALG